MCNNMCNRLDHGWLCCCTSASSSADLTERTRMPIEYDQYFQDSKGVVHRVKEEADAFSMLMAPVDDSITESEQVARKAKAGTDDAAVTTMAKGGYMQL